MRISDWSSDVCSSDLHQILVILAEKRAQQVRAVKGYFQPRAFGDIGAAVMMGFLRHSAASLSTGPTRVIGYPSPLLPSWRPGSEMGSRCHGNDWEIGRESCRGRVWKYV